MTRLLSLLLAAAGVLAITAPDSPKPILDLQQFRRASSIHIRGGPGRDGVATLVNLNPAINTWYTLSVSWSDRPAEQTWHLENPRPREARIYLDEKYPSGIAIAEGSNRYACDVFAELEEGRKSPLIYYPLCGGRLYLRNPAKGQRTALESAVEFLRDLVWGGEELIDLFHHLLADRYRETAELRDRKQAAAPGGAVAAGQPLPALIDPEQASRLATPENLGITLESQGKGMLPGAWYAAAGNRGIYVSVIQPNLIAPAILKSYKNVVGNLDNVEAASLCYLVAFDLDRFEIGYALGTDYPGWAGPGARCRK